MDRLEITEYRPGDQHVLVVHGELDIATAPALCERMTALRDRGRAPSTVLDLTDLQFCDSTGLRALLGEVREAEICGGDVRVVAPAHGISGTSAAQRRRRLECPEPGQRLASAALTAYVFVGSSGLQRRLRFESGPHRVRSFLLPPGLA